MDLRSGQLIDERFRVERAIGFGSVGGVYRVRDEQRGTVAALKLLYDEPPHSQVLRRRFLTEARIMADLQHPNLLPVHAVGEYRGQVYFVMEYAPLGNVHDHFRIYRDPRSMVKMGIQVLDALSHVHRHRCIHRDVKPANVLRFEGDRFKLTDFGLALYDMPGRARCTATGDNLGTIGYMSPEQRVDPRDVTPASDIYATGAMLYALLTGAPRPPPDLYAFSIDGCRLPGVPASLCATLERATRARSDERYSSAAAMAAALRRVLETWS